MYVEPLPSHVQGKWKSRGFPRSEEKDTTLTSPKNQISIRNHSRCAKYQCNPAGGRYAIGDHDKFTKFGANERNENRKHSSQGNSQWKRERME